MKKIVFTGGHHNSALSVARKLLEDDVAEIVWFGHKYSMLGDKNPSAEFQEIEKLNIPFRELKAGKFYRTFNLVHLFRLPFGFLQAFQLLLKEKPDLIVSFGGYLAAPVVFMGWVLRIPSVTHEQTTVVGFANKFNTKFAKKIFVTWPQSKKFFPVDRVALTGLPLRDSIFDFDPDEKLFNNELPIVYVTGGKQGSHVINENIANLLPKLLEKMNVIHQCGANTQTKDYEMLQKEKARLPNNLQEHYRLEKYIFSEEIGQIFNSSDVVISRAGAHTVYELAALGKPSLFIPIPWVSHNEQYKNARLLVNAGSALILPEERLSPKQLEADIDKIITNIEYYQTKGKELKQQIILDARDRIIDGIVEILDNANS